MNCSVSFVHLNAEKVIGCHLPSHMELYTTRTVRQTRKTIAESHPGHGPFKTVSSSKRLSPIRTRTSHHKNSFFPTAETLINGHSHWSKCNTDVCTFKTISIHSLELDVYQAIALYLLMVLCVVCMHQHHQVKFLEHVMCVWPINWFWFGLL